MLSNVNGSGINVLIDDFIVKVLSIPFCPYHFVQYHFVRIPFCPYTILSVPFCPYTILSVYHFVHTILSVPFCPYHFVCIPFCPLPFCPRTVHSWHCGLCITNGCRWHWHSTIPFRIMENGYL